MVVVELTVGVDVSLVVELTVVVDV